jgi:hypothetical protein
LDPEEKINNSNTQEIIFNKRVSNNFKFPIHVSDTLFVLTRNRSDYKDGINNMISKMVTIKDLKYINLDDFSKKLGDFGLDTLNIFSINIGYEFNTIDAIRTDKGSLINYFDIGSDKFIKFINSNDNFLEYNKNSLYILRNGNFLDIKNIFSIVSGHKVNIGIGRSQKSHILSPLDLRLSFYMMAMFAGNYRLLSYLNTFYDLSKDRYLSYTDNYSKPYKYNTTNMEQCEFKPIAMDKMPLYCKNNDLGQYFLECADTTCSFDVYNYLH